MYGSALTFPLKPGFCGRVYQFYKSRQIEHIKTSANSAVKQAHVGTTTHISHTLYAIAGNAPVYVSACLFSLPLSLSLFVCLFLSLFTSLVWIYTFLSRSLSHPFLYVDLHQSLSPSIVSLSSGGGQRRTPSSGPPTEGLTPLHIAPNQIGVTLADTVRDQQLKEDKKLICCSILDRQS